MPFFMCHGPKKLPKYHLKTILTRSSQRNKYYGAILVKINFCHAWKCMISGVFHRTGFWHLWRKPAIIFSKWMFFQKFWKNIHFENMTAGFLPSCQNCLRWEISFLCHSNIDSWKQKMSLGHVMVPKNYQNII